MGSLSAVALAPRLPATPIARGQKRVGARKPDPKVFRRGCLKGTSMVRCSNRECKRNTNARQRTFMAHLRCAVCSLVRFRR